MKLKINFTLLASYSFMKYYLLLFVLIFSSNSWSQLGPELPDCPACDNIQQSNIPTSGLWWNPEQSGTGLSFEIQGDTLLGTYYAYDLEGQSVWYNFVGSLVPSNDPKAIWEVTAQLLSFSGGQCFNCEHQLPQVTDFIGNISIKFNQANHASIQVDDGDIQNIVPFLFSNSATTDFEQQSKLEIPDLVGVWVFSFIDHPVNEFNPIKSSVLRLSGRQVQDLESGTRGFDVSGNSTDAVFTTLSCRTYLDGDGNIKGPICALFGEINLDGSSDVGYFLNIGDIGINKMVARRSNGDTVEAYKLEFENTSF